MVARSGAQVALTAAINELEALVLTAPLGLREELRSLTVVKLDQRCARFRPDRDDNPEVLGTKTAMRSLARRIQHLTAQAAELEADMKVLVEATTPQLLDEVGVGVGVILATQVIVSWSHPGQCRTRGGRHPGPEVHA